MQVFNLITKMMNFSMWMLNRQIEKSEYTIESAEKRLEDAQQELTVASNLKAKIEALGCSTSA